MYLNKTTAEFENWQDIRWRVSRISDEYLAPDIKKPKNLDEVPRTTLPANNHWTAKIEHESEIYSKYAVESGMDLEITIQKAYFPGWLYLVNGKQQLPRLSGGLPVLVVNKGSNVVELIFRNTPVRIISNIISLVSTIGVLYFYYGRKTYS